MADIVHTTPRRRSLLAAFLAAPVVAAVPALAATFTPPIAEAPGLLDLGERLSSLGETLLAAVALKDEAFATYERTRPALPADLLMLPKDRLYHLMTEERELPGGELKPIYLSRGVRAEIILRDLSRNTKEGQRLRRIARIAKVYEDAELAALEASAYDRLHGEAAVHGSACFELVKEIKKHTPATMLGVLVFARAISLLPVAAATMGYTSVTELERPLATTLAASLVRIGGEHHG